MKMLETTKTPTITENSLPPKEMEKKFKWNLFGGYVKNHPKLNDLKQ